MLAPQRLRTLPSLSTPFVDRKGSLPLSQLTDRLLRKRTTGSILLKLGSDFLSEPVELLGLVG